MKKELIKIKNEKKAQLKIQEMSFMILALLLFFIIAGLFYVSISASGLKKDYAALAEAKAISTIEGLASTPEFNCGRQICIDTDKVLALKNNPSFSNYWDLAGLVIKKVYPFSSAQDIECEIGNYYSGECTKFTIKQPPASGYEELASFVSLCRIDSNGDSSYTKCEIGKISAYIKK